MLKLIDSTFSSRSHIPVDVRNHLDTLHSVSAIGTSRYSTTIDSESHVQGATLLFVPNFNILFHSVPKVFKRYFSITVIVQEYKNLFCLGFGLEHGDKIFQYQIISVWMFEVIKSKFDLVFTYHKTLVHGGSQERLPTEFIGIRKSQLFFQSVYICLNFLREATCFCYEENLFWESTTNSLQSRNCHLLRERASSSSVSVIIPSPDWSIRQNMSPSEPTSACVKLEAIASKAAFFSFCIARNFWKVVPRSVFLSRLGFSATFPSTDACIWIHLWFIDWTAVGLFKQKDQLLFQARSNWILLAYLSFGSFCSKYLTNSLAVELMLSHSGDGKSNFPVRTESKISASESP